MDRRSPAARGGAPTVYGLNVRRQLEALADKGIIARPGVLANRQPPAQPPEWSGR